MSKDILRRYIFRPYLKGYGPEFSLTLWYLGRDRIGYCLRMDGKVLFKGVGEDFGPSPLHAINSDEVVAALLDFLTAGPGDMDDEHFKDYTPEQLDYCAQHAKALSRSQSRNHRYGKDN